MWLDLIPRMDDVPAADSAPSRVRSLISSPRASQCSVLRGLVIAVAIAMLMPFEWALSRREAIAAGPTSEYTRRDCTDAYPRGYGEQSNNWWSGGPAACFGGMRRGSWPCDGGKRHFEGFRSYSPRDEGYSAYRISSACGPSGRTRNAWRWTAGSGLYRCSDAWTTIGTSTGEYAGLTIAMCRL